MARVMLADDDPDYSAAFERGMIALGHEVVRLASGERLLHEIERARPDILFLDVLMPGGGAISLVHEIRAVYRDLPIVVITGNSAVFSSPIVSEGMRQANARVRKSVSLIELQELVRRLTA